MAGWIKMPLGMEVGLGPGDFVLGSPAPLTKKWVERRPQFSANVHCGQTAGWIMTAFGKEVGLDPGHIVLDTQDPSPKMGRAPNFRPTSIVAKQLYVSGYHMVRTTEVGLSLGHIVLDGDPAPFPKGAHPIFGQCPLWPNGCMN